MSVLLTAYCIALPAPELPTFSFIAANGSLSEHYRFGFLMGSKFTATISKRFDAKAGLKEMVSEAQTPAGAALLHAFVNTHDARVPEAMAELRGIAVGAGRPFEEVFLQNIPLEFSTCSPKLRRLVADIDDCSDLMACDPSLCAVGHNEDNQHEDIGATALVTARWGSTTWTAYTYLGELPSGAFGYNDHGLAFSLNWVGPKDAACPGLGRGFVSRQLLEASTLDAALAVVSQPHQSTGHNYQLMQAQPPAILNVEAGPGGVYAVRPIGLPFFHANQYQSLRIPQTYGNSSVHRLARVAQLAPPRSTVEILHTLGDQADREYPIFHDQKSHDAGELSDWTVATALFDLLKGTVQILHGNPRTPQVLVELPLLPHPSAQGASMAVP